MVKDIYELISIRKNWISINRENNFENGIKNLLSNMYPDEAHFIYELLQNAEDKKAKHVYFKLTKKNLIFEHDAGVYDKTQLFTLKDIESITGIGTSTKRDDNTTIGKFGVLILSAKLIVFLIGKFTSSKLIFSPSSTE